MSAASLPRPSTVRITLAEQFEPVLRVHAGLEGAAEPAIDSADAQRRIRNGQIGYDALRIDRKSVV